MKEGLPKNEDEFFKKQLKDLSNPIIEDKDHFEAAILDAKVQFNAVRLVLKSMNEEDFITYNSNISYLGFIDYLKSIHKTVSPKLLENTLIASTIMYYDDLIKRIKDIKSKDDFKKILEEVDFNLK